MNPFDNSSPKSVQVQQMFDRIAPSYDRLNTLLSFGRHKAWRRRLTAMVVEESPTKILDAATGTGDMALRYARRMADAHITAADFSPEMLSVARRKIEAAALSERIDIVEADAEHLPFADGAFDCLTVVFGVRNFQNVDAALKEFQRVLRNGGRLLVMEFSMPKGKIFGALYRFYQKRFMPAVGGVLSHNREAYRYLPESIPEFAGGGFADRLRDNGFSEIGTEILSHGITTIYSCRKR